MKKAAIFLLALFAFFSASANSNEINDISIKVRLCHNGSAVIHEVWDVEAAQGTEIYLVRSNLGDIEIPRFTVIENGKEFELEEEWNPNRTLEEKEGRCGILHKTNGVELCWGCAPYGHHCFHAIYLMTNAVKTMDDYDMLHLQLISDALSSAPQHVKVSFFPPDGGKLDTLNTRFWGFGFEGTTGFADDSTVVFESTGPLKANHSVIALMRFEKGLFESASVREGSFQDVLDKALEGASFADDEEKDDPWYVIFSFFFTCGLLYLIIVKPIKSILKDPYAKKKVTRKEKRKVLGCSPSKVMWWRDLPYDGDLPATAYTMVRLGEIDDCSNLASALILRMIYDGQLLVGKNSKGKTEISFANDVEPDSLGNMKGELFRMLKSASGEDKVLQDREFSHWAIGGEDRIVKWLKFCKEVGINSLQKRKYLRKEKFTEAGHMKARETLGFKKFLDDFTLVRDKSSIEVHLWQEYLVYAALYGMTEKVAKELKDIDETMAKEVMKTDFDTFTDLTRISNSLSAAISIARPYVPTSHYSSGGGSSYSGSSRSGYGGHSSSGGGHGYSSGGHGGGFR